MNGQIRFSPNPDVNEVIHTLLRLGCPPIPVAPKPDPRKEWCHVRAKTKDGWEYCPLDKNLAPLPKFTGKNPSYLGWNGSPYSCTHRDYQDKLPTRQEIRKFFSHPDTGVGTIGGHARVVWIDFDTKQYASQEECDVDAEAVLSRIPSTWVERTGSGGWRIAVKLRRTPTFTNFATDESGGIHRGEALFTGRFTVLAPTIHPSGNPYRRTSLVDPVEVESLESIGIFPAKEAVKQQERKATQEKRKKENPNYGKSSNPVDDPWDMRNYAPYFEGYKERKGWGTAQCPHHANATSITSFYINLNTGQYGLRCGCDTKDARKSGLELAISRGYPDPRLNREWQETEATTTPEEWEWKHGLRNWFKEQLNKVPRLFKGFGKQPQSTKTAAPHVQKYMPGQLPTPAEYKASGSPVLQFSKGERLQLLREAQLKGHHDVLDSSATGTGKSYDVGLATPEAFSVHRLFCFSPNHRNPTTKPVEANYEDMPVRNNGLVVDESRRTALNNAYVRWPQKDENPNTEGNCFRAGLFHALATKGYQFEAGLTSRENPVCGTCHLKGACTGKDASVPGSGFRRDRRDAFLRDRIRASLDSAPSASELEAKEDDATGEVVVGTRNAAFLDEAMKQIKPVVSVEAGLSDFDQMFGEVETKLPSVHEALKQVRLALRPLLAGEVAPTKETYHGWNDATIRNMLPELGAETIADIIEQLKSIQPNFEEILTEPDGFTKDGVAAQDRKGVSNGTSKFIRSHLRQESYRTSADRLKSLPSNWLIPFLEVLSSEKRGALRINNGKLAVITADSRHKQTLEAMEFVVYLDATANREYLALSLGIEAENILHVEQEPAQVANLSIVQVTDLGLVGHERSKSLKERLKALKPALRLLHPDISFLEHKAHAEAEDGWWFNHNRGSNEYMERSAMASFGTPYENIGQLQDLWLTLTGDRNIAKDAPGFSGFVRWQAESEVAQAVGRLRANIRPEEQLTYYSCGDDLDLAFLERYYPGATITQRRALDITPAAGREGQQTRWALMQGVRACVEAGKKLTQAALANHAHVTQGRISQILSEMGGWKVFKKLLATLLESLYRTTNNFHPISEELEWIATGYLPLVAEDPPETIPATLAITAKAHGREAFEAILAATSPETRGRLLGALLSLLPATLLDELSAIAPPTPATGGQTS